MNDIGALICLIGYAPIALPLVATSAQPVNETQLTDTVPGWDDWLHDNNVAAAVDPATGDGTVRGRAWGVSNPFTNFRSVVGAEFGYRFLATRDRLVGDVEYEASVRIRTRGKFLHFAAVPYPDDPRTPPAVTVALVHVRLRVAEVDEAGATVDVLATSGLIPVHDRVLEAGRALEDILALDRIEQIRFTPSGGRDVVFRVSYYVHAAAAGEYSDIRIRGTGGSSFFVARPHDARVARVLHPDDPCFRMLRG